MEHRKVQIIRTPTGQLSIIRPIAEKLLAEGVISGTLDGELHAADAATVKAAVMAGGVCDFCSAPGPEYVFEVPDFDMPHSAGRSTGGWSACAECNELVRADRRDALLDRAVAGMSFSKFSRRAIAELHTRFWKAMDDKVDGAAAGAAAVDYINGTLQYGFPPPKITQRDVRMERIMKVVGLTRQEMQLLLDGKADMDVLARLAKFAKGFSGTKDSAREVMQQIMDGPVKPAAAAAVPHWQQALDARFQALAGLSRVLKRTEASEYFPEPTDLKDKAAVERVTRAAQARIELREMGFYDDIKFLRAAQAYSFNAETIAAIREAARSVPHDAPLSSIETPNTGAGWFWFGEPLPIKASPVSSDRVNALLWGWSTGAAQVHYRVTLDDRVLAHHHSSVTDEFRARLAMRGGVESLAPGELKQLRDLLVYAGVTQEQFDSMTERIETPGEPALVFSAYVVDERGQVMEKGQPTPSTRWDWPMRLSFHDMLAFNGASWDDTYGPGGRGHGSPYVIGKDETLHCVGELSLFFVMACLWFRQTVPVLTQAPGHVERHARKRYVREHKLPDAPTVQVVALRKTQRVPVEDAPADRREGAREYHCRWIVKGHPRLQPCGPGRKDRKLIWIEAYPAGPPDKPLRTREKVYAVVR